MSAAEIIKLARKQVGYNEGRSNGHWNNHQKYSPAVPGLEWSQNQPWCATFVSWLALKTGQSNLFPRTASCDVGGQWFQNRDRWSEYPAVGAQVFYGSYRDLNHTGLVYKYDDTFVYTIEGNTNDSGSREGDGVYLKKRRRRDAYVVGYGYPEYPEGIDSADPKWKDEAPKGDEPKGGKHRKTRGPNIDAAIRALRKSKPSRRNRKHKRAALKALRSIKPWNK